MKPAISIARRQAGILLIECLVYIAVFAILLGIGMAAFYFCWDHSKALIYATDDIEAALRAGEHWRADVRAATGKISVEATVNGEVATIPEGGTAVVYQFNSGEVRRLSSPAGVSQLLLPKVKNSQMKPEARNDVSAWCWELELAQRRKEIQMPLLFTFEAVQKQP